MYSTCVACRSIMFERSCLLSIIKGLQINLPVPLIVVIVEENVQQHALLVKVSFYKNVHKKDISIHICQFFCFHHSNMFLVFLMFYLVYQLQCSGLKFRSYNFMLKPGANNNDVTCVANMVLIEEPNCYYATYVANNLCLPNMGAKQYSMVAIQPLCRKPTF